MQLKAMREHCVVCQSCAKLARVNQFIIASLDETEQVRAPKGLADMILASVDSEELHTYAEKDMVSLESFDSTIFDCSDFEKNAAAFVEGGLNAELIRAMEKHYADCPACARVAEVHRFVYASLNNAEPVMLYRILPYISALE